MNLSWVCSFSEHQQWQRHQQWSTEKNGTNRSMATFAPPFWLAPLLKHQAGSPQNHRAPRDTYPGGRRARKKQNKRRHQGNWVNLWVPELRAFLQKNKISLNAQSREWKRQRNGATFLYHMRQESLGKKVGKTHNKHSLVLLTRSNIESLRSEEQDLR